MWRVTVYSFDPVYEDETYNNYDFNSDLEAWRFHELVFKSINVSSVTKPVKIF